MATVTKEQPGAIKKGMNIARLLGMGLVASKSPSMRHAMIDMGEYNIKKELEAKVKNNLQ